MMKVFPYNCRIMYIGLQTIGGIKMANCQECGGKKKVACNCTGGLGRKGANDDCPACGGEGVHMCFVCDGTGRDKKTEY